MKYSRSSLRAHGFSLPEVAIATAIAALGIITLLGLLPTGLENVRQAGNNVAIARIYQQMVSEIQSADWGAEAGGNWTNLRTYDGARRHFDSEGTLLNRSGNHSPNQDELMYLSYVAKYEFVPISGPIVPGASSAPGSVVRSDAKRVIIHVATTTNPNFNFDNTESRHEKRAYTIARQF